MTGASTCDDGAGAAPVSVVDESTLRPTGKVIRIGFVVHTFDMGGIERSVARLANGLDRRRYLPLIFCLNRSGAAAQWIAQRDVNIVELNKRSGNDWRVVGRLAAALRRERVSLVHSHNWGTLVETVLARRWAGTPRHVHAERGTLFGSVKLTGWQRRLRVPAARRAMLQADQLLTNAQSISARLQDVFGLSAGQIEVIPNGVDLPGGPALVGARDEIRRHLGAGPQSVVIGSVGRLVDVKDFGTLLAAVAKLADAGRDVHLLLVGDGPRREQLLAQAASCGIGSRLHLPGQQEEVGRWLAAMDVYVNSSVSEGMSQSIVEALAAGLPLVVTDVGDNALLTQSRGAAHGLVVPRADADAMSDALQALADVPQVRQEYARRARACHAENYSVARMMTRYEALYERLLASVRR